MALLHLPPCNLVGELKNAIKEAILEGIIPNEYEAAKAYLLDRAAKMHIKEQEIKQQT